MEGFSIIKRGEKSKGVYLILQGTVLVQYKGSPVHSFGPNEHFGHFCLFEHLSRYEYKADEPTICLFISSNDLEETLMKNSKLEYNSVVCLAKSDLAQINKYRRHAIKASGNYFSTPEKGPLRSPNGENFLDGNNSAAFQLSEVSKGPKRSFKSLIDIALQKSPIVEPEPEHHLPDPTPTADMIKNRNAKVSLFDASPVIDNMQGYDKVFETEQSPKNKEKINKDEYEHAGPLITIENQEDDEFIDYEDQCLNDLDLRDSMDEPCIEDIFAGSWVYTILNIDLRF